MPTYEFRCPKGHGFERFYKTMSTSAKEVECPECGEMATRQLSGGGGLMFKGSGFYLTDYGKNAHRGGPKPTSGEGGTTKPDSSKSEAPKAESAKSESAKPRADAPAPRADSPKPKSSKPKSE